VALVTNAEVTVVGNGTATTPRGPRMNAVPSPGAIEMDAVCWQVSPLVSVPVQPTNCGKGIVATNGAAPTPALPARFMSSTQSVGSLAVCMAPAPATR
jgi:hypothetical protein